MSGFAWGGRWLRWLVCLPLLCGAGAAGAEEKAPGDVPATQRVAEVLFLAGSSRWSVPAGSAPEQALRKGDFLPEGARIETGDDGYVYLGTRDQGFVVLRPRTTARIARYRAQTGERVEIRLELERGVARVVSGQAAHAQPQGFRMETPLAVIGVRGTDFSVLAGPDVTRVAVRQGGVVVSPLSDACRAGGIGPCLNGQTAELFARDRGQLIEVRRGMPRAILLGPKAGAGPDGVAPPGGEENHLLDNGRPGGDASSGAAASLAVNRTENGVTQTLAAVGDAQASVPAPPPAPTVFWGRWAGTTTSDVAAYEALTDQGRRQTVAMNPWFALTRQGDAPSLPSDGVVSLSLVGSQALIVNQQGAALAPAQALGGQLTLNFGQASFQTSLTTQGGGYTSNLQAAGAINPDGTFDSNLVRSNGSVRGAIESGARSAAYLFQQNLDAHTAVTGVASWAR